MSKTDDAMQEIYKLLQSSDSKNLAQLVSEKKEQMGISELQMSKILGIDKSTFSRLIKKLQEGNIDNIDFYSILKICQLMGISVEEMSQIYVASLNSENIKELERARKAHYIIQNFDIKGLKDADFIENITDFDKIEQRIVSFFRLDSIFQYNSEIGAVAFSRTKNISHDKMREFWVRSAIFQFEKLDNPNDYKREELLSLIPNIGPYTRFEEKGFWTVIQALYNIGITVIVQSYLSKTQVRGGTFSIKNKPCIVITDYNKRYYSVWQALMHELYHVLYDFEQLKSLKYHLTGEAQSDLYLFKEDYADYFGWEMLFQEEKLDFIKHMMKSDSYVYDYAEKNKIHPSIIYGFYCFQEKTKNNKDFYGLYQHHFGKTDKAFSLVKSSPWSKETNDIFEGIEKIKKVLTMQNK